MTPGIERESGVFAQRAAAPSRGAPSCAARAAARAILLVIYVLCVWLADLTWKGGLFWLSLYG